MAKQRERNIKHWPRAWKVEMILKDSPHWGDLLDSLEQGRVDGRVKPGHGNENALLPTMNRLTPPADAGLRAAIIVMTVRDLTSETGSLKNARSVEHSGG